jgi:hypothetical protein
MRTLVNLIVVAAVTIGSAAAQSALGELPPVFMGTVKPVVPPDVAGAWTLQVITRGGFTGRGADDVVVVSDGSLRRTSGITPMRPEVLMPLAQRIRVTSPSLWTVGSRLGTCNDCFATLVVLTLRDRDGALQTYTAFWDATTRARIPTDVLQIHDLALSIEQQ